MKFLLPILILFIIGCSAVEEESKAKECQKRVVYQLKEKCKFKTGQKVHYIKNVIGEVTSVNDNQFTLCIADTSIIRSLIDPRVLEVEISKNIFVKVFPLKGLMDVVDEEQVKAIVSSSFDSSVDSTIENELKTKMESLLKDSEKVVKALDTVRFDRQALEDSFNKLSETLDSLNLNSR
ncbi:MAG: hypothetical protein ACI9N1_000448 [Flavobacteriales bacterium]|jgi:hypothetical protein